jgi:hypothetical protein
MSRVWVTIDGVWFDNWIYWILKIVTTSNISAIVNSLHHALSLLSLLYLHRLSPDNGFQRRSFPYWLATVTQLTPTILTAVSILCCNRHCSSLHSLNTDRIENRYPSSSDIVASRGYRAEPVENTIPVLLFTAITWQMVVLYNVIT